MEIPSLGGTVLDLGAYDYALNTKLIGVFGNMIMLGVGLAASAALGGGREPVEERTTVWNEENG